MKNISDYIVVFDNVVTDALCNAILAEYKDSDDWIAAVTGAGKSDLERQCDTIGISFDSVIQKNQKVRAKLDKYVFASAGLAIKKYNAQFPLAKIQEDSGYDLLRYKEGQFYTTHTDSFKQRPRAVSCSFALNEDYEGGEFAFFSGEQKYKLRKRSCIMFPSNFMYPHEIMPVTSGTRYSLVTWFV
jgi:hypothetical protein